MPIVSVNAATLPAWRFVSAVEAVVLERWDADANVRSVVIGAGWRTIPELGGSIREGVRLPSSGGSQSPFYRPSQLQGGVIVPEPAHLANAPVRSVRAVGPGDILVSKFLPPRAALVTPETPRHPPDANCLRVLGLDADAALWLTAVLGHPSVASALALRGAGSVLPRVGARDLAELKLPPPPEALRGAATSWNEAADARLASQRELLALQAEVQSIADDTAPPVPDARCPGWIAAEDMPDTWAPDQAALVRFQHLATAAGWVALGTLLAREPARLRDGIPPARLLRLTEAAGDLAFDEPEVAPIAPPWFRVYADPLRPGEVLLSTLGSAPKVVLNQPPVTSTVWLSDQWARLDAGEAAGAVALLLGTQQVIWQLGCAATGAVRQFIGREELAEISLPALPPTAAGALHRRVVAALERRRKAERRLASLRSDLARHVEAAFGGAS